ncbi:MAG: asparagine synthase (glutamine-hydrolyzing), partial [Planctomycetota bacterium]|nr:asparagine synthase (glutamine-hydrolyzing) [Planctomycetota bacterium]
MCGIAGYLIEDGRPIPEGILERMTDTLTHRGPDASGFHRSAWHHDARRQVGLGHRRLSIIDLSENAHQPIPNEDRTLWIAVNGEIYNFRELRDQLLQRGHTFRSGSDSETILHLYEEHGIDFVHEIDGMFALALWDARSGKLILVRDRIGKKPLYWARQKSALIFGSEIKALLPFPNFHARFDPEVLPILLALGYVPSPRTCHQGVFKVPPGSFLLAEPGQEPRIERYWDLDFENPLSNDLDPERTLHETLDAAVQKRLVSDRELGAFLSGGVDSSIVVSTMARLGPAPLTFTIGFEGEPDEVPHAKRLAKHVGAKHIVRKVQPDTIGLLDRLVHLHDEPFGDTSSIPTHAVCQLAREHAVVALSGDGGDELFAGYTFFPALEQTGRIPKWIAQLGAPLLKNMIGSGTGGGLHRVQRVLARSLRSIPEQIATCHSYGPWDLLGEVFPDIGSSVTGEVEKVLSCAKTPQQSLFAQLSYVTARMYLHDDLLVKIDRMSMAHGLEIRSPMLDTALLEWVPRLSKKWKLSGQETKILLRKTYAKELPAGHLDLPKSGFSVPLNRWFREGLEDLLRDSLLNPNSQIASHLPAEWIE